MPPHATRQAGLERPCAQCGTLFWPYFDRNKYCSRVCLYEGLSTKVECSCERCGATFMAKPSQIARGRGVFCSRLCTDPGKSERLGTTEDRFWSLVDKTGDCWPRSGANDRGYASFDSRPAHHFAYVMRSGIAIPKGFCILHTCDNRACVRNDEQGVYVVRDRILPRWGHLALGTALDNSRDCVDKGRHVGRRKPLAHP